MIVLLTLNMLVFKWHWSCVCWRFYVFQLPIVNDFC